MPDPAAMMARLISDSVLRCSNRRDPSFRHRTSPQQNDHRGPGPGHGRGHFRRDPPGAARNNHHVISGRDGCDSSRVCSGAGISFRVMRCSLASPLSTGSRLEHFRDTIVDALSRGSPNSSISRARHATSGHSCPAVLESPASPPWTGAISRAGSPNPNLPSMDGHRDEPLDAVVRPLSKSLFGDAEAA